MNLTDEQVDNLHRYLDESAPAIAAIGRLDKLSDSELADHVESLAMAMGEENAMGEDAVTRELQNRFVIGVKLRHCFLFFADG